MGKLLGREALLVALTGLFAMVAVPALYGKPVEPPLFWIGLAMGLTYMAIYAMTVLAGNKMPAEVRKWIGVFAWIGTFGNDLLLLTGLVQWSLRVSTGALYLVAAPGLCGVALAVLAAFRSPRGERVAAAYQALYSYSFPMSGVRFLLVPLVRVNEMAVTLAFQGGAFYMALRVLMAILWPGRVEGNVTAPPLVRRPVPDAIVGLVEGTSRRRARPFATERSGERNEEAISILCSPKDVPDVVKRLKEALADKPFSIAPGEQVEGQVEVVVRPHR